MLELSQSRDNWKSKYSTLSKAIPSKRVCANATIFTAKGKPAKYTYGSLLILLSINIMSYSGTSLRSCKHFLTQLFIIFELNTPVPCHSTIRMWFCKAAYYQYHLPKDKATNWALIVDESVSLGENKAFVVLGIPLDTWTFTKTIKHSDVELLYFEVIKESKKEYVSQVLEDLKKKYSIKYVISDKGNNLLGAYRLSSFTHIPDCTHVLAKSLERYFKKNEVASSFLSICGKLRQKWNMGKKTIYIPPSQRKKARFHNLSPLIKWAQKIENNWFAIPEEIKKELTWFKQNKESLQELKKIDELICFINKTLKKSGYSAKTAIKIEYYLVSFLILSKYAAKFIKEIREYLLFLKGKSIEFGQNIICNSDIIESIFGKIKYSVNTNSSFGMTEFSFALAAIGNENNSESIKKAMENTTENKIKIWKNKNIAPSLFQKKKDFFNKKVGEEIVTN